MSNNFDPQTGEPLTDEGRRIAQENEAKAREQAEAQTRQAQPQANWHQADQAARDGNNSTNNWQDNHNPNYNYQTRTSQPYMPTPQPQSQPILTNIDGVSLVSGWNLLAIISITLAILSLLFGFNALIGLIGGGFGLAANRQFANHPHAGKGSVLSTISIVLAVLYLVIIVIVVAGCNSALSAYNRYY